MESEKLTRDIDQQHELIARLQDEALGCVVPAQSIELGDALRTACEGLRTLYEIKAIGAD